MDRNYLKAFSLVSLCWLGAGLIFSYFGAEKELREISMAQFLLTTVVTIVYLFFLKKGVYRALGFDGKPKMSAIWVIALKIVYFGYFWMALTQLWNNVTLGFWLSLLGLMIIPVTSGFIWNRNS